MDVMTTDITGVPAQQLAKTDVTPAQNPAQTAQTNTGEKTEEAKPDELSPKFAALAKREKQLRARAVQDRRELEAQRQALEAQKKALEAEQEELRQYRKWKSRLSDEPAAVLNEAGVSYDKVTSQFLNQPNPEIVELRNGMKSLQSEIAEYKNQLKQSINDQYESGKRQIRTEAKLHIDGNDQFEAIRAHGEPAIDAVMNLIERTLEKKGYLMPIEQALQKVESKIVEQALGYTKLKKVQEKLAPAPTPAPQKNETPQQQQTSSTLSSRMSAQPSAARSERERMERAILAFQGKLS